MSSLRDVVLPGRKFSLAPDLHKPLQQCPKNPLFALNVDFLLGTDRCNTKVIQMQFVKYCFLGCYVILTKGILALH